MGLLLLDLLHLLLNLVGLLALRLQNSVLLLVVVVLVILPVIVTFRIVCHFLRFDQTEIKTENEFNSRQLCEFATNWQHNVTFLFVTKKKSNRKKYSE